MSDLLQFNSQLWKQWNSEGLTLFLPREKNNDRIYFSADWSFVHPDVEENNFSLNTRKLYLSIMASVSRLHDWRHLSGTVLGDDADEDENSENFCHGPDLSIYFPRNIGKQRHDGWNTKMTFGLRDEYEFEFSIEAFRPSERASKFNCDYQVKEMLGQPVPPDWELPDWLDEGDTLSFSERIRFDQISCSVPINCSQPIEWAKQMAAKELNMHEFGFCRVNGGEWFNGKFKPQDGVGEQGRLVILNSPTDYFYEWQEQQRRKQPE